MAFAGVTNIFFRAMRTASSEALGSRPVTFAHAVETAPKANATAYGIWVRGAGLLAMGARRFRMPSSVRFSLPRM